MILLDKKTLYQIFDAPEPAELDMFLKKHGFSAAYLSPEQDETGGYTLSAAVYYAHKKHPGAENIDVCSFAGLVQYYATGWYGGFGTEDYEKERIIDNIMLSLVGGSPAAPDSIVSFAPDDLLAGGRTVTPEETEERISILDRCYFGDLGEAVAGIIESIPPDVAARVVLSMARTQADYKSLAKTAGDFLKRKATIGDLRRAVKITSDKLNYKQLLIAKVSSNTLKTIERLSWEKQVTRGQVIDEIIKGVCHV